MHPRTSNLGTPCLPQLRPLVAPSPSGTCWVNVEIVCPCIRPTSHWQRQKVWGSPSKPFQPTPQMAYHHLPVREPCPMNEVASIPGRRIDESICSLVWGATSEKSVKAGVLGSEPRHTRRGYERWVHHLKLLHGMGFDGLHCHSQLIAGAKHTKGCDGGRHSATCSGRLVDMYNDD